MRKKIRVLIVDDSIFFRKFMSDALSAVPSIEVAGLASDAYEAMEKIGQLNPDVVTLDIEMPKMRGTDFLRKMLPKYPGIQVVAISSVSNNVFEALKAGAVDFVSKPSRQVGMDNDAFIKEAVQKICIAASLSLTKSPGYGQKAAHRVEFAPSYAAYYVRGRGIEEARWRCRREVPCRESR